MAQNCLKWKSETDRNMAIAVTKALREIHEGQLIIINSAIKSYRPDLRAGQENSSHQCRRNPQA